MSLNTFLGCASLNQRILQFLTIFVFFAAGLFDLSFAFATEDSGSNNLEKVTLQLRWRHQFQFAGYYAAKAKGYYQKAGLDVQIKAGGEYIDPVAEVVHDNAQYGVSNSDILLKRLQNQPVVVLAVIFQHSPLVIIARAETGIHTPQGLIGKKVMMNPKRDVEVIAMLQSEGIALNRINVLRGKATRKNYLDPHIDALAAYITNQPYYLQEKAIPYMIIRPSNYGIDFYGDSIFTSEKELSDHPDRVRRFRAASLKGWQYAMEHSDEIIDLIINQYSSEKPRKHLRFEADAMRPLILPDLVEIGHINEGRWRVIADTLVRNKMIQPGYSLKGFIYSPEPEGEFKFPWQVVGVAGALFGIILFSALILLFLNQRLHREVKERKQAVMALHSSEREKTAVLNAMTEIVAYLDWNLQIIWGNHAAAQRLGLSTEEMTGHSCQEFWRHNKEVCRKCPASKALKSGETEEDEIESVDGKAWLIRAYPVKDDSNEVIGIVYLAEDITQKQKQEGELLRTIKLESIGVLAGGIAHDFNNMLTAVMGYIALAQMKINPKGKTSEFLADAEKAAMRARDLAQKLLTFSKGGEPIKKRAQISKSLTHAIDLVLSGSNIDHELNCPENLSPVEFDQTQMEEAFRNILTNAKEAMPNGGHIAIKAENVFFGKESLLNQHEKNFVKISFIDRGTGIPNELLEKIFDPYFSTKEMGVKKGMGLGLSITHSIIKKHHGLITVESVLGKGATFNIYLPATVQTDKPSKEIALATPSYEGHNGRIMLMDDEKMIWEVAGQMLTHLGYEITYAADGDAAIEIYKEAKIKGIHFDAVILDLTIKGGLGGKDTIAKLLEIDPKVKAFVSSGYSDDPVVTGYKAYGFFGVIVKPYNIKDLSEALANIHP